MDTGWFLMRSSVAYFKAEFVLEYVSADSDSFISISMYALNFP